MVILPGRERQEMLCKPNDLQKTFSTTSCSKIVILPLMTTIAEVITGIFYQPTRALLSLKAGHVSPGKFFLFAGLPFIAGAALGRAWRASQAWEQPGEVFPILLTIHLVSFCVTFLLGAVLIQRLAPRFKSQADIGLTLMMVVTTYIPFLTALALSWILPESSLISFVGLTYTIFVFGKATGLVLNTPPDRIIGFTVVCFLILFGGNYVVNLLLELLFLPHPII